MPRFHFHLRARGEVHRDLDGTELQDVTAARSHASVVTEELMRHAGVGTRHSSMCVEDDSGEPQFDLFFADVDPSLAVYSPQMRILVSETCRRLGALTDVLCAAHATRVETRMLLARARGKPHLVYARGTDAGSAARPSIAIRPAHLSRICDSCGASTAPATAFRLKSPSRVLQNQCKEGVVSGERRGAQLSIGGPMGRIENHDGRAWRARAEECRAIADTFDNPETRAKMLAVAADYERMAENAERREQVAAHGEAGQREQSSSNATGTSP